MLDPHTPEGEAQWLAEQRERVVAYLQAEEVAHGDVAGAPELHMAPHLALWVVAGPADKADWWVVSGDVPTDHVSSHRAPDPRAALRTFAKKWRTAASVMATRDGDNADGVTEAQSKAASRNLFERAKMLWQLAEKDELWEG